MLKTEIASANRGQPVSQRSSSLLLMATAWGVTLLVSLLPDIFMNEIARSSGHWLLWGKLGLTAFFILGTFAWKPIRPLRGYLVILLVLQLAGWLVGLFAETALWSNWFTGSAFTSAMLEVQVQKLLVALIVIAVLLVIRRRPSQFFLTKGQADAPAEAVRWLGIDAGTSWARLAPIAALCISMGTLAFLLLAGMPSSEALSRLLPLLPAVIVFAGMNAFSETMSYRASLLSTSHEVVGRQQALLLTAAYFGIAHFYGVPYGVPGVLMASFLGWFLSKAMLETRGLFWPWFIHICQDILIFAFLAMGSVVPGG